LQRVNEGHGVGIEDYSEGPVTASPVRTGQVEFFFPLRSKAAIPRIQKKLLGDA
jgi:hypothetical protein